MWYSGRYYVYAFTTKLLNEVPNKPKQLPNPVTNVFEREKPLETGPEIVFQAEKNRSV